MKRFAVLIYAVPMLAACSHQQSAPAGTPPPQATAPPQQNAYGSKDFVGDWTCQASNGQISVVTTSTVRADGTAIGRGTAYGHTTPLFESSWSYTATGPATGLMHHDNLRFPPPHYAATAAVTWHDRDHYSAVTKSDTNPGGVGSRVECRRSR